MYRHAALILAMLFAALSVVAQERTSITGFSSVADQFEEPTAPQRLRLIAKIRVDPDEFQQLGSIRANSEAIERISTEAAKLGISPVRKISTVHDKIIRGRGDGALWAK